MTEVNGAVVLCPGLSRPGRWEVDASYVRELAGISLEMLREPVEDLVQPNARRGCAKVLWLFGSSKGATDGCSGA